MTPLAIFFLVIFLINLVFVLIRLVFYKSILAILKTIQDRREQRKKRRNL